MMNYNEQLFQIMRSFVHLSSEMALDDVIDPYDNSQPENLPQGSYSSVFIGDSTPYGRSMKLNETVTDGIITRTTAKRKKVTVTINFYRDNAFSYASRMEDCISLETIQQLCFENGLGISEVGTAKRKPEPINARFEEQASIQITMFYSELREQQINNATSIDLIIRNEHQEILNTEVKS